MSYVDMLLVCRNVAQQIKSATQEIPWLFPSSYKSDELHKAFAVFSYIHGWPETADNDFLTRLDAAVDVGWKGK